MLCVLYCKDEKEEYEEHIITLKQNKIDLTSGSPFEVILKFAIPVIGGNLFQLFYTLADSMIVGKTLGANSLAAVGQPAL